MKYNFSLLHFVSLPTSKKSKFAELVTKQIIDLHIVAEDSCSESGNGPPAPPVSVINDIFKTKLPLSPLLAWRRSTPIPKTSFFHLMTSEGALALLYTCKLVISCSNYAELLSTMQLLGA